MCNANRNSRPTAVVCTIPDTASNPSYPALTNRLGTASNPILCITLCRLVVHPYPRENDSLLSESLKITANPNTNILHKRLAQVVCTTGWRRDSYVSLLARTLGIATSIAASLHRTYKKMIERNVLLWLKNLIDHRLGLLVSSLYNPLVCFTPSLYHRIYRGFFHLR